MNTPRSLAIMDNFLSETDVYFLEQMRSLRLQTQYSNLLEPEDICLTDDCVVILARYPEHVDRILENWDTLPHFSWLHTGRSLLSLYFIGEEIETTRYSAIDGNVVPLEKPVVKDQLFMSPATLEKPQVSPTEEKGSSVVTVPQFLDLDTLASGLASTNGRHPNEIKAEILSLNPQIYVDQTVAIEMIDRQINNLTEWRNSLQAGIAPFNGSANGSNCSMNGTANGTAKTQATKSANKSTGKTTRRTGARKASPKKG